MYIFASRTESFKETMRKHNERWRQWVDKLRLEQNLSARDLAERAHMSHTTVNKILKTGYVPETPFVEAIGQALGQNEEVAKEMAGIFTPPDIPIDAPEEYKRALRRLYRLPIQGQNRVWALFYAALEGEENNQDSPQPQ